MKTTNTQELSIQARHEQGRTKWTSPIIVTLNSEKSEGGKLANPTFVETDHKIGTTPIGS